MSDDTPEFCFFQVSIAGQAQPLPIVIQLNHQDCPKTCQNFAALCSSTETTSPKRPFPTYRGTQFHRLIEGFMVQGGDFERFDGTGGFSPLFQVFDDENLKGKHGQAGIVSMANAGRNTNKSQFFITLKATPHLDGKHVVFGKVISGMESVFAMLAVEKEGDRPVPMQRIVISECGIGKGDDESSSLDRRHPAKGSTRRRQRKEPGRSSRRKHRRDRHGDEEDLSSEGEDVSFEVQEERRRRRHKRKKKKKSKNTTNSSSDDSSSASGKHNRRKKHSKSRHHYSDSSDAESYFSRRRKRRKKHRKGIK